jgi:hypothetical protein
VDARTSANAARCIEARMMTGSSSPREQRDARFRSGRGASFVLPGPVVRAVRGARVVCFAVQFAAK